MNDWVVNDTDKERFLFKHISVEHIKVESLYHVYTFLPAVLEAVKVNMKRIVLSHIIGEFSFLITKKTE